MERESVREIRRQTETKKERDRREGERKTLRDSF